MQLSGLGGGDGALGERDVGECILIDFGPDPTGVSIRSSRS